MRLSRLVELTRRNFRRQPLRTTVIGVLIVLIVLGIVGSLYFVVISAQLPSEDQISNIRIPDSTKIYDRNGILLYDVAQDQKRTVVPLADIPDSLKQATIDIEDAHFYTEPGVSLRGIARALFVDITHVGLVQGGSTITQQLARNTFLSPKQTLTRKIQETLLAIKINHYYTKDQVLELYLNEVPYGPTIYGVETASEDYFGKPVSDLDLAQSALIASLPKAPSRLSPYGSHVDDLRARQRLVLQSMLDNGHITQDQMNQALSEPLVFQPQYHGIKAPHFVMMVEEYLAEKYGEDTIQKGGLKVTTTLDWTLQQSAEKTVADGAARNEQLYQGHNAALVAEDPKTGQILSLVGSRDYFDIQNQGNFDVATQALRQPGSSIKPFVYLDAFEKGYTANTIIFDVPTEFAAGNPSCPATPNYDVPAGECFHPVNFEGTFLGPVTMRQGLAESMNVVSVKTLYLTGMKDAVSTANQFGISTLTDPARYGLSLVLGGGEVRLIDMMKAYSALSQEGVMHPQAIVLSVQDAHGQTLESYQDQPQQLVDPNYAREIDDILSDVNARAPLFQASLDQTVFPGYQVALKTGTTNDYRDAWSYGFTPNLVVGVWAGNNNNAPMQKHGSSILAAVPIWSAFMREALPHFPADSFTAPSIPVTGKPILDGQYVIDGQVHDTLYYVNRSDPTGAPPASPSSDPQFNDWEYAVQQWVGVNGIPQPVAPDNGTSSTSTPISTDTGGASSTTNDPFNQFSL